MLYRPNLVLVGIYIIIVVSLSILASLSAHWMAECADHQRVTFYSVRLQHVWDTVLHCVKMSYPLLKSQEIPPRVSISELSPAVLFPCAGDQARAHTLRQYRITIFRIKELYTSLIFLTVHHVPCFRKPIHILPCSPPLSDKRRVLGFAHL